MFRGKQNFAVSFAGVKTLKGEKKTSFPAEQAASHQQQLCKNIKNKKQQHSGHREKILFPGLCPSLMFGHLWVLLWAHVMFADNGSKHTERSL
jgi:hypothetical protein